MSYLCPNGHYCNSRCSTGKVMIIAVHSAAVFAIVNKKTMIITNDVIMCDI